MPHNALAYPAHWACERGGHRAFITRKALILNADRAVENGLSDERHAKLLIGVDDPESAVASIKAALPATEEG